MVTVNGDGNGDDWGYVDDEDRFRVAVRLG